MSTSESRPPPRRRRSFSISAATQRSARFLVALGLIVYEATVRQGEPRWLLLALYGTMMGLPLAERADELLRSAMERFAWENDEGQP